MTKKKQTKRRGTDEPFLRLMGIGGPAVLRLLGIPPDEAEDYRFRSVVLKEKRMEPDVEGIPILESRSKRAYVEFQGYSDPFIRYRLMSRVMLACVQDRYEGQVLAGIIYTDEKYKKAALPVKAFGDKAETDLEKLFEEIVLTDYTEKQLTDADPRLIVLAPFTVPSGEDRSGLIARGREWKEAVHRVYPKHSVRDALNIMGLLIMNRFRDITREEVIAMLNFDLLDTVAGQQIFEEGALRDAREMVLEALTERFVAVPDDIRDTVHLVGRHEVLKELLRCAIRTPHIQDFGKVLLKISDGSELSDN